MELGLGKMGGKWDWDGGKKGENTWNNGGKWRILELGLGKNGKILGLGFGKSNSWESPGVVTISPHFPSSQFCLIPFFPHPIFPVFLNFFLFFPTSAAAGACSEVLGYTGLHWASCPCGQKSFGKWIKNAGIHPKKIRTILKQDLPEQTENPGRKNHPPSLPGAGIRISRVHRALQVCSVCIYLYSFS